MSEPKHSVRFPGESDAYRAARNELLDDEIPEGPRISIY